VSFITQSCGFALHWATKRDAQSALGHFPLHKDEIILKLKVANYLRFFLAKKRHKINSLTMGYYYFVLPEH
jgi:hypothetical protein